jgi:hypothetical protein
MRNPRPRPRPLADLLDACLAPALRAQGFASADILAAWPEIVGERLSGFTQPVKIEWKRKPAGADPAARPEPSTLVVRVEGAFALEVQHLAPVIVERVNAHYGWRCVGKLVLKQGPVRRAQPKEHQARRLDPAERARVEKALEPIAEAELRTALDRLGEAVIGSSQAPSKPTKP